MNNSAAELAILFSGVILIIALLCFSDYTFKEQRYKCYQDLNRTTAELKVLCG